MWTCQLVGGSSGAIESAESTDLIASIFGETDDRSHHIRRISPELWPKDKRTILHVPALVVIEALA
jgi:hypothetical protein